MLLYHYLQTRFRDAYMSDIVKVKGKNLYNIEWDATFACKTNDNLKPKGMIHLSCHKMTEMDRGVSSPSLGLFMPHLVSEPTKFKQYILKIPLHPLSANSNWLNYCVLGQTTIRRGWTVVQTLRHFQIHDVQLTKS